MKEIIVVQHIVGGRMRKRSKVPPDQFGTIRPGEESGLTGSALRKTVDAEGSVEVSNRMVGLGNFR